MNRLHLASFVLLVLCACGDQDPPADGTTPSSEIRKGLPDEPAPVAVKEETCDEVTELEVVFSDKEPVPVGAFDVTHTTGFIAGMRYNGKQTAKLAYVVLANYEPTLTSYDLDPPTEEGQVALILAFKTKSIDLPFEKQNEEYAKMAVPTATFAPGWMSQDASFQVTYYVGGKPNGPAISGDATGEATLTHSTPNLVCGTIDFTSENGTTIQGTFSVKIEKDMWAQ